jgi:DNA polymerase III delta subunit
LKVKRFEDFEKAASEPSPGRVFLLAGPEPWQSTRLRELIVGSFTRGMGFEHVQLAADDAAEGDIRRRLSEGSLFSEGVVLDVADAASLPKRAKAEMLEAVASPGSNCILCRTEQTRLSSGFLGNLEKASLTYMCWEPFQRDMHRWNARLASEYGVDLTRDGAQTLEMYSSGVLRRLAEAMERLSLYYSGGERVDRDGVLRVLTGRSDHTVFDLADLLYTDQRTGAMDALLSVLRAGEEPVRILAFLWSQWNLVSRARDILSTGGSPGNVSSELGLRYMQLDRVLASAGRMHSKDPVSDAETFASADAALKSGGDSFTVMAGVIFALTSGRS